LLIGMGQSGVAYLGAGFAGSLGGAAPTRGAPVLAGGLVARAPAEPVALGAAVTAGSGAGLAGATAGAFGSAGGGSGTAELEGGGGDVAAAVVDPEAGTAGSGRTTKNA